MWGRNFKTNILAKLLLVEILKTGFIFDNVNIEKYVINWTQTVFILLYIEMISRKKKEGTVKINKQYD